MNKKDLKAYIEVLYSFFREKSFLFACVVVNGILIGLQPYVSVILMGRLIDAAYAGEETAALVRYALFGTGAIALLMLGKGITNVVYNRNMEYMFEEQNRNLNKKSMLMDYEFLEDIDVHNKRQRINSHSYYKRFGLMGSMLDKVWWLIQEASAVITAVIIVIPMFFVKKSADYGVIGSAWMSLGFIALIIGFTWANFKAMSYYNEKLREVKVQGAPWDNRRKYYLNVLSGAETQKDRILCEQQGMFRDEMDGIFKAYKKLVKREVVIQGRLAVISQAITVVISTLVYVFAGLRGFVGMITLGSVVTYAASIARVSDAVYNLVETLGWMKEQIPYISDYREFMTLEKRKHEGTIPVEKRRDNKFSVEFDHVSFRYPGSDTYVLKDVSLSFVIGEKLAIVGKNGSGKTTFIKLLCRLYDVTEGCIKVNGIDIKKYNYQEYCNLFAAVFQDFAVFDFPLGENLAGSTEIEEARAADALERAGLGERLKALPRGLSTYVGKGFDESGVNFSGGEKQKIAIARAIYKNAPFVIMDEPTAALDPEAEAAVFEGFDEMVGKKTAIYISHRLASCKFCEDILVFDAGKVVQHGSHEELKKQDGVYRELWNAQAQYYGYSADS